MTANLPIFMMFHDDDCGELLDKEGCCPTCQFSPDMQSTAFREVKFEEYAPLAAEGRTFLGLRRTKLELGNGKT